jgi:hypothetical protein
MLVLETLFWHVEIVPVQRGARSILQFPCNVILAERQRAVRINSKHITVWGGRLCQFLDHIIDIIFG